MSAHDTSRAPAPRTAGEVLERSRAFLAAKGVEGARLDAELLVAEAVGLDRLGLFMALDRPVVTDEIDRAREALVRRASGEPTAYILGRREFYGRDFRVSPAVLIPRPETELLVDKAREALAAQIASGCEAPRICDLGTGSGCIAITLALEVETARVLAIDLSPDAIAVARANAEALGVPPDRLGFRTGDAFEQLAAVAPGGVDLVVSNPPYIDRHAGSELAAEVRANEPALALFAPDGDPDFWVRRLIEARERYLAPGGRLLVELGFDQAPRVEALAAAAGAKIQIHEDLAGIPRLVECSR